MGVALAAYFTTTTSTGVFFYKYEEMRI